mmetsp:Transcript_9278/g.14079  ORF Transcript_9278/g.14079 Transcript_9278/m.14079 type:complete len:265 (+) Transcript_9278:1281-2075(+)
MLDLQTCVHLQEVKVSLRIDQHLHGTSALVVDSFSQRHSLLSHRLSGSFVNERTGGLFDNLLVSPLDGALSLWQIHSILVLIHENLNFDVTGLIDELFDKHTAITEGGNSFSLGDMESFNNFFIIPGNTETLSSTTSRSLDHDRVSNLFGKSDHLITIINFPNKPRDNVDTSCLGDFFTFDFVTHSIHGMRSGTNEDDIILFKLFHKSRSLRQETIPWVNSSSFCLLNSLHNSINSQVTVSRRRGTNTDRLIGHFDMLRQGIGL